ncbi:ABC transporter substrate-binding protein [Chitinimonas lacunae]|uniref:ABC transporter substrate-binding protein n=1 Tax=Chitinimonas lacunae TaxID=1963018 RepID=A0ABV8MSU8_9NEIS
MPKFPTALRSLILAGTAVASLAAPALEDIRVGQIVPSSYPTMADDARVARGTLRACIDSINARGGINGHKLVHVVRDDAFDGNKHAAAARELIEKDKVVALLGAAGIVGPLTLIRQNVLNDAKVPLIGPIIGAEQLRNPVNPYVFHTRASWTDEIRKIIEQIKSLGGQRVAILYQNDADGKAGLFVVKQLARRNELEIVAEAGYDPRTNDVSEAARKIIDASPHAVFLGGLEEAGGKLVKALRAAGSPAQMYAVSVVDAKRLYEIAGSAARGTGIAQTMPYPYSARSPLVKDYQATVKKFAPELPFNYLGMETYLNCRVLAEGLKRAGPQPTGEKLMQALETMQDFDLGGFKLNFSPDNRAGSRYVEITVMDGEGRLMR